MTKKEILKYWENVRELTLKVLDRFPEHQSGYRPADGVRSVAKLFDHILAVELYARKGIIDNIWGPVPTPALGNSSLAALRVALVGEHSTTIAKLRLLPETRFTQFYDTPFGKITGEGMIYLAIDEEIHHRGNLYAYLRMLGVEPPQMVQRYFEIFLEK
jgi:uncharacterized damage-inducible protein DinB